MDYKFSVRIGIYTKNKIGLKRGDVVLEPHIPRWKRVFSDEAYLIFEELRSEK
jgi:hypothetical protein